MSWTDYYLALFGLPAVLIIWMMMVPLLFMFLLRVPMTRCLLFFLDYQVVLGTFTWVMEISRKLRQSVLKALPTQTRKRKGKNKKQTKKAHSSWHVLQNDMLWHEVEKLENSIPAYWRTRILLFWLHLILESQFGSILYILLISFEVVFSVFPP